MGLIMSACVTDATELKTRIFFVRFDRDVPDIRYYPFPVGWPDTFHYPVPAPNSEKLDNETG